MAGNGHVGEKESLFEFDDNENSVVRFLRLVCFFVRGVSTLARCMAFFILARSRRATSPLRKKDNT